MFALSGMHTKVLGLILLCDLVLVRIEVVLMILSGPGRHGGDPSAVTLPLQTTAARSALCLWGGVRTRMEAGAVSFGALSSLGAAVLRDLCS